MTMQFADRMELFKHSDIQEILKVTAQPDIISFGGGLPAPELFPVEKMKEASCRVLDEHGAQALQYFKTEGLPSLREKIAERSNRRLGTFLKPENVIIVTGSQQALDLSGKFFLNKDDVVLCESPTYLGAVDALKVFQPRFVQVETDDKGMVVSDLEKKLQEESRVRLIYVTPDFQNPTGTTWPEERRKAFMDVVNRYSVPVLEDNPYGELRFEGSTPPALKSYDIRGNVLMLGSFSKVLSPGMRVAWISGEEELLEKFVFLKQASDINTATKNQLEIDTFLDMFDLDEHIAELIKVYGHRKDVMISAMEQFFPDSVRFTRPEGGLFTWAILPEGIDARDLLAKAVEKKVAFVPGGAFYPNGGFPNTLRLNYSNMPPERIREGIKVLGEVMAEYLEKEMPAM